MLTFTRLCRIAAALSLCALSGCPSKQANFLLQTTQYCEPLGTPTVYCYSVNEKLIAGYNQDHQWNEPYYIKSGAIPAGYKRLVFARLEVLGHHTVICDKNNPTVSGFHAKCNMNGFNDHETTFSYQIEWDNPGPVGAVTSKADLVENTNLPSGQPKKYPSFRPMEWSEAHGVPLYEPAAIILTYEK